MLFNDCSVALVQWNICRFLGNVWEEFVLLADYEAEPGKQQQLSAKANELVVIMKKDESGMILIVILLKL